MKRLSLLLTFLIVLGSSTSSRLLASCELELKKMIAAHHTGDTSLAFSIAIKVKLAAEALHQQMEFTSQHSFLSSASTCSEMLTEVVSLANSPKWAQNFQAFTDQVGVMQLKCTNADFVEAASDINGFDNKCALCVVILRVMENYVSYHRVNVADFVNTQFCAFFDVAIKATCEAFIHYAGPTIINALLTKNPSDSVCIKIGYCTNPNCRIVKSIAEDIGLDLETIQPDKPAPWQWLIHIFVDKFGNGHLPVFDYDNDTYSDVSTFRGYNWRGNDCNQLNSKIYPGRKTGSKVVDHDCNGIFGMDNRGRLYEQKFCAEYRRIGIAVIGDSAGAHFSIPEKYFNASMIKKGTYDDLLVRLADQLDIPHESSYTAHVNTTYKSHSVYKYLRDWNLCNNNDYQNIGVNGGASGNTWDNIQALSRNTQEDYPLLMFLELIGNDVCKKSFDSMKKPQDFKRDILKLLKYLDTKVPAGSHLLMFGLGDGDLLYQNLHADIHPLNVTYGTVYDFLNCLKISPCWGWLNSNDTVREFTTQRAKDLSKVYQELINQEKFVNFDMAYYDFPALEILGRKVMEGGDPKEMIQRCDGFHPNGQFNSYLADWIWYTLKKNHPEWIGTQNPHNEDIRRIFNIQILK